MAITMIRRTPTTSLERLTGNGTFSVAAGKTLTIETSPQGEEILSATVPDGRAWSVELYVIVTETDA